MTLDPVSIFWGFILGIISCYIALVVIKKMMNVEKSINPLHEELTSFRQYLERLKIEETKDREKVATNIDQIFKGQNELLKETTALEKTLKGDIKLQGQWGEIVLEKILELNNLKEGEHYSVQGKGLSLKSEEGSHLKPDAIIHLPEDRHLIIDSKVNLKHYIEYQKESDENSLKNFINSFKNHLKGLSDKNYQKAELNNPDFVLLFVPMDSMYALLLEQTPDLINKSFENKVVVVSPTSLVAVIKLVHHLWLKVEQTKNAQKIADLGSSLYDKFALFHAELENLGKSLKKNEEHYQDILNKLVHGKGNLIDKANELKRLGIKNTKDL